MDFEMSSRAKVIEAAAKAFFLGEILPRHADWVRAMRKGERPAFVAALQAKARAAGLWNLALPDLAPDEPGTRLANLEYAPVAELVGRLTWAPEVFNCQPPDVPNMIMLQHMANPVQKARWLRPLLEGRTRSCFGMTEPAVASSDATNIATLIAREDDDYVVDGRKWFITGAAHPDCSFCIVLGVTDAGADRTRRHTAVIVPMDAPGVTLVRSQRYFGLEDQIAPIGELVFDKVRVPVENRLGAEGEGFRGGQTRLGPARLHHCMRAIGMAESMVELMMARAAERRAFGRTVIEYDTVQRWIAEARVDIERTRLLVLRTAWLLDRQGHDAAWRDVSLIKIAAPAMLQTIADRAAQVFGAMGGSDDVPIHRAFVHARMLRIGDGPDEVHIRQIFRQEPKPDWTIATSPYVVGAQNMG